MLERKIPRGPTGLNGVMHRLEGRPQAVFRLRSSPRYPTGDIPGSGHFRIGQLATILLPN
jgi:hypothetical protein